jgi:inhibitor of cysteine peptidase
MGKRSQERNERTVFDAERRLTALCRKVGESMKYLAGMLILLCGIGFHLAAGNALASPSGGAVETAQQQEVQVGKEVRISLASNRTTGYQWKLAQPVNGAVLQLVSSQYVAPGEKMPGAGGTEVWVFKAVGPGKADIHLEYVRPWEKGQAPARTATYSVEVK